MYFARKFNRGLVSRREHCWGYVFVNENTPKKLLQLYLVVQGSVQLEHSSDIVKVGVAATCYTSSPDVY